MAGSSSPYRRVLLKLSGEALMGPAAYGIHVPAVQRLSGEIRDAMASGVEIAVVVGGGNIFRGLAGAAKGMDRATADYMGMLATVMNCLALHNALEQLGVAARVMSAIPMPTICESYVRSKALHHLECQRAVIFAAGTGNPFFSTDTAAALRAMEVRADCLLKATKVDGIYDRDPIRHAEAKMLERVSYDRMLSDHLGVMDATAVALCRDNGLKIRVFRMTPGNIRRVCLGETLGTTVSDDV